MTEDDPDKLNDIDQEIRINELREEARELTGGEMVTFESDDAPPEVMEAFWQNVVATERDGWISSRQQLQDAGVELPRPADLNDEQLAAKLAEVIDRLAALRTFLHSTDHLSDRQLYEELFHDVLDDAMPAAMANAPTGAHIIDMIGSGSEEDLELYLKYYADEDARRRWLKDFPNDPMPPSEKPPYDRDRHLPKPPDGL